MFLDNKYTKWYYNIIETANTRANENLGYIERHHIMPKSLGGSTDKDNLVKLTGREHFIVHRLLTKMCDHPLHIRKMKSALGAMMFKNAVRGLTSRQFEIARSNSKGPCPSKARAGKLNGMFGKTHTQAVKDAQSVRAKERFTGKSYEEIMGAKRASETKEKRRVARIKYLKENPQVGIQNPNVDKTIYSFINVKTNETFSGTQIEFRNFINIGKSCCWQVIRNSSTVKKWKLLQ